MTNHYLSANNIFLYSGSTFDGCLSLKDIHDHTYFLSEGEQVFFFIEKKEHAYGSTPGDSSIKLTLTKDDMINGKYPFMLSHKVTETMIGDYFYYAFIRFANGDYYQIVPHTLLFASKPCAGIDYWENKNTIYAKIPRVMRACDGCDHQTCHTEGGIEL